MAYDIAPRMTISGTAHRVTEGNTTATESSPARPCGNVVVLTDGGGFAEVYLDPDQVKHLPKQGERVLWTCDVSVWNKTLTNGQRFGILRARLAEAYDPAAAQLREVV